MITIFEQTSVMSEITSASIIIHVVPSFVWEALTDQNRIERYLLNCSAVSDWEQGSTITFSNESSERFQGTVTYASRPHKLVFSVTTNEKEVKETIITYELEPHEMKTKLTVTQDGSFPASDNDTLSGEKHWQKALHLMRNELEKELNSFPPNA